MNKAEENKAIIVLHDKDIFPSAPDLTNIDWKDRRTGKVVLFDNKKRIALIGNKVNNFFLLPGGGIEDNEDIIAGTLRECREETGCLVEILESLGKTEDFRARDLKHCISFGYLAKIVSRGEPTLTENEKDIGAYVTWVPIEEATILFANQEKKVRAGEVKFYNTCFNIIRDGLFIRQALTLVNHHNS